MHGLTNVKCIFHVSLKVWFKDMVIIIVKNSSFEVLTVEMQATHCMDSSSIWILILVVPYW